MTDIRPNIVPGEMERIGLPSGKNAYIFCGESAYKIFEVFVVIGKSGSRDFPDSEAIGRLISLNLRSGIDWEMINKQLNAIGTFPTCQNGNDIVKSSPDAIALVMRRFIKRNQPKWDWEIFLKNRVEGTP